MITDEPVRGSIPPPWFSSLSGIERVRTFNQGALLMPPLCRLLGIRSAHVGVGSGTWVMPASAATLFPAGQLEIVPFMEASLHGCALTAMAPGVSIRPLTLSANYFRPVRPQPGNLLARARVANISSQFVFTEVEIEDAEGRQIAHACSHAAIETVDPPPPAPPSPFKPVDEPAYATPDPYLRAYKSIDAPVSGNELLEQLRRNAEAYPIMALFGVRFEHVERGHVVFTAPASEWFCLYSRHVSAGIIASLNNVAGWCAGLIQGGGSGAGLDKHVRFHAPLPADGRPVRFEGNVAHDDYFMITQTQTHASAGTLIATASGSAAAVDEARRAARRQADAKRVLTTLLFTDIVDSTGHAERLGDERWRTVLDEHHARVRREIARNEGIEVKTIGDGFFARFESPARAVACARIVRDSIRSLGIEIRAGIHTGECELHGRDLAGMAVHLASRIQAAAVPGEILVSGTVKDLTVGSEIRFTDRGEHELKGVAGRWRLYCVAS